MQGQASTVDTWQAHCTAQGCLQIEDGVWYGPDGKRRVVTQYHETIGYFLGDWAKYIVQILVIINLFGTNVSQV